MTETYTEVEAIGSGGFGVVHKVLDSNGNEFARKTFAPASYIPVTAFDKLRKRFIREILTQESLGGDSILPVLDHDTSGSEPWFIMPLAEMTYDEKIEADRISGDIDVSAVADILNGLECLHRSGYVHRDLNPRNILLHDGAWKLSDLGAVLPPSGVTMTLTGSTTIYTEQYCSPEQRQDFHRAKSPSDVYSFGCILHDIFGSGARTPYSKQTAPGTIGLVIEKCTETNPSRRPQIAALRTLTLEALLDAGGHCKVVDAQAEEWLAKLDTIEDWDESEFDNFVRFFGNLDLSERSEENMGSFVTSLSTPFLTRVGTSALKLIAVRNDWISESIAERYCEWVKGTAYEFSYADLICGRLTTLFDEGSEPLKAMAYAAMISLGATHNRWFVMQEALGRSKASIMPNHLADRIRIELVTEGLQIHFKQCANTRGLSARDLAAPLAQLLE